MNGLQYAIGESTLAAYLVALARTAGFVLVAPPFNTRAIPVRVRVSVALGLAIPISTMTAGTAPALQSQAILGQMVLQALTGLAMGFFVMVAVAVVAAVGDLIDLVGGFNLSMAMDPLMMTQTSVMGRLHSLIALVLIFVSDSHLLILRGLTRSVQLMPSAQLDWQTLSDTATKAVALLFLSAVQVAAPIIAAMLIADIALGLLTRAAPALNAFALGFPLKILLTLVLTGLIVSQLPGLLASLITASVESIVTNSGGG